MDTAAEVIRTKYIRRQVKTPDTDHTRPTVRHLVATARAARTPHDVVPAAFCIGGTVATRARLIPRVDTPPPTLTATLRIFRIRRPQTVLKTATKTKGQVRPAAKA